MCLMGIAENVDYRLRRLLLGGGNGVGGGEEVSDVVGGTRGDVGGR